MDQVRVQGRVTDAQRAEVLVQLLESLARQVHTVSFSAGLKPAQWAALRFITRANRSARTVSGFAKAAAITRAAASQTVKFLIVRGFVHTVGDPLDGRIKYLELTTEGAKLLQYDPLRPFVAAVAKLDPDAIDQASDVLARLAMTWLDSRPQAPAPAEGRDEARPKARRR